jgi:hypothetical protein
MKTNTLKGISDKMRKYEDYTPAQPRNENLPPCYNICLSASPKGGGKTYNCILLLQAYEKSGFIATDGTNVIMRTIWIAGGTSRSKQNNILNTLDSLHDDDRIDMESDVDNKLTELYDSLLKERDEIEAYMIYIKTYKKFMKKTSSLNYEELLLLQFKKYIDPKDDADRPMDSDGNILDNPRVVFIVLDDMISGDAFSNTKKNNFLNRLSVKSRHESNILVGLNLFFITQSFKSIPAIIRRQTDIFILLKSASQSYIIDAISEETGSHFSKKELEELYIESMKIPYGALILSIHKKEKEENRVRLGWSQSIVRDPKYII